MNDGRQDAARLSLGFNVVSTVLKVVAAGLTGSVSLLGEATHSATDVAASALAFLSIRAAARPPDEDHPYGHGKIESVAGFGEAILLFGIVGYLGVESVRRIFHPEPPAQIGIGIGAMVLSALGSAVVARKVGKMARETGSLALASNAQHLVADSATSFGVLAALLVYRQTGWAWADPAIAILLAVWLAWNAAGMTRTAFNELIDRRVDDAEVERVRAILDADPDVRGYHALRTRHSGADHFVEVHIELPGDWTLEEAHRVADRVETAIETALAPAVATVHVDPLDR